LSRHTNAQFQSNHRTTPRGYHLSFSGGSSFSWHKLLNLGVSFFGVRFPLDPAKFLRPPPIFKVQWFGGLGLGAVKRNFRYHEKWAVQKPLQPCSSHRFMATHWGFGVNLCRPKPHSFSTNSLQRDSWGGGGTTLAVIRFRGDLLWSFGAGYRGYG